jgi:hypothetical protein
MDEDQMCVPSIVRLIRIDVRRADPYWPAQLAALASILLYVALPNKLTIGPDWLVPVLESVVFVALVLATPGEELPATRMRQLIAVSLIAVLAATNLAALGLLARYVIEGGKAAGRGLLEAAIVLEGTIVLVFGLIYWEIDGGGPVARGTSNPTRPVDFMFPQTSGKGGEVAPEWQPSFVDYLYLSLTNSTAFSPTDTMPLSHRAKMTMGIQALASMVTIGLLIGRAVQILR